MVQTWAILLPGAWLLEPRVHSATKPNCITTDPLISEEKMLPLATEFQGDSLHSVLVAIADNYTSYGQSRLDLDMRLDGVPKTKTSGKVFVIQRFSVSSLPYKAMDQLCPPKIHTVSPLTPV